MLAIADIERAAEALAGRIVRTPVVPAPGLGDGVTIKAELFQRSGSFKLRGALNRVLALTDEERRRGVICVSAGNHAAALALAAGEVGTKALVLMPRAASEAKVARARGYGATVDLDSADSTEAFSRMAEIAAASGRVVVHPFDDPLVMAGAGTVGLELADQIADLSCVVVPVGGGGLVAGIAVAVKARRPAARVIAVQSEATTSLRASLTAGHPVPRRNEPTIADALTPPSVGVLTLAVCASLGVEVVEVSEEEIAAAMRYTYAAVKLACEPGAAAPIAALLTGRVAPTAGTVAVVSGGNVEPHLVATILAP